MQFQEQIHYSVLFSGEVLVYIVEFQTDVVSRIFA